MNVANKFLQSQHLFDRDIQSLFVQTVTFGFYYVTSVYPDLDLLKLNFGVSVTSTESHSATHTTTQRRRVLLSLAKFDFDIIMEFELSYQLLLYYKWDANLDRKIHKLHKYDVQRITNYINKYRCMIFFSGGYLW